MTMRMTRRSFLGQGAAAVGGFTVVTEKSLSQTRVSSFVELLRVPDAVTAYASFVGTLPAERSALKATGAQWHGGRFRTGEKQIDRGHRGRVAGGAHLAHAGAK